MQRLLGIVGIWVFAFGLLVGCASSQPWSVPTEFVVYNAGNEEKTRSELERALTLAKKDYGYKLLAVEPLTFRLSHVKTYDDLADVQKIIERVASQDYAPTRLSSAAISFQAVEGSARATIQAAGKATPGAVVLVDAGQPRAEKADVGADGGWAISVPTSPTLLRRKGEVYALIRKARTTQIIKTNVFEPDGSTVIGAGELPADSTLRSYLLKHND